MANNTKAPNKSEFVRKLSSDLSAAEVVAKAKAAGIKLTPGHVYTIRAAARRKSGAPKVRGGRKPAGVRIASLQRHSDFVALALDLGLAQSEALLARLRSRIGALVS